MSVHMFTCTLLSQGLLTVDNLRDEFYAQVAEYREIASRKSDLERTELQKEKTGVFSGGYARNPANGEAIPIWVADYVLGRLVHPFS